MNPKYRGFLVAGIILLCALIVGLYGYSVGSYYKQAIVSAYHHLYDDIVGYLSSLAGFFRDNLGVHIQF